MPLQKLVLRPGINKENTNYGGEGGWYDCDKVRFRSGNPEKIGGWVRVSDAQYQGLARSLWNWTNYAGNNYLGVGTNLKYYIEEGGVYNDITPIRQTFSTTTTDNCFATTIGSNIVTVTISGNGSSTNDFVTFSGATAVGGIPALSLNLEFQVTTLTSDTFTIVTDTAATSTVTAGGGTAIVAAFQLTTGPTVYSVGTGWGAGGWGVVGWGLASPTSGVGNQLLLWTNDNYGQDLIIAQRGGGIHYWKNSWGLTHRAESLQTLATGEGFAGTYVPHNVSQIMSSSIQRFVIAFGANPYLYGSPNNDFDPMLVRWSDQENPYQWVPDITNQSGEFRLTHGSYIVTSLTSRQENLVWTDSAVYSMQYLGAPYVWSFNLLMDNISIVSPNSVVMANDIVYWMGVDKFYMYSGKVGALPCTLKQFVFEDFNYSQTFQVFSGGNSGYNEVWWFYCSEYSTSIDKYVIYNYLDDVWYHGSLSRSAWLDSATRTFPISADYNNRLLYHEASVDDVSGELAEPIYSYVTSSDYDIEDGQHFGFIWRMLPDVNFNGSTVGTKDPNDETKTINGPYVNMTIVPRRNSGDPYGTAVSPTVTSNNAYAAPNPSVYVIQEFTGQVYTRLRGRQMSFKIESTSLGVAWQLGAMRVDTRLDGRR
jgi:hypothetical protein